MEGGANFSDWKSFTRVLSDGNISLLPTDGRIRRLGLIFCEVCDVMYAQRSCKLRRYSACLLIPVKK